MSWYKICSIKHVFLPKKALTILIKIPLNSPKTSFEIYFVLPLIQATNKPNLYQKLTIPDKYFAISTPLPNYHFTLNSLTEQCQSQNGIYYCDASIILKHKKAQSCVYAIFTEGLSNMQNTCQMEVVVNPQLQVIRTASNTWFLHSPEEVPITWQCTAESDLPNYTKIKGSHVVTIPSTCHAFVQDVVLYADFSPLTKIEARKFNNVSIPWSAPSFPELNETIHYASPHLNISQLLTTAEFQKSTVEETKYQLRHLQNIRWTKLADIIVSL